LITDESKGFRKEAVVIQSRYELPGGAKPNHENLLPESQGST